METPNQTLLALDGRILFYSLSDFIEKIVKGDNCFICGASPETKPFNNEHVLPTWLLREYDLLKQNVVLQNNVGLSYSKYTVPCCEECNNDLAKEFEDPISDLLRRPYEQIVTLLREDTTIMPKLYLWLNLICFKAFLKDSSLRFHLDKRKGLEKLSDMYDYTVLHHNHCIARSAYTKASIESRAFGTLTILPAMSGASIQPFDYVTNNEFPAILLRMHDFCLISVLNDCGGVGSIFRAELKKIRAPLSPLQLREIFANYVFIYQNLKVRPSLYSNFGEDSYSICASFPEFVEVENVKEKKAVLSDLIWQYTKDSIPPFEKREEITDEVRLGKRSFLFDNTGNIVDYTKSIIQV